MAVCAGVISIHAEYQSAECHVSTYRKPPPHAAANEKGSRRQQRVKKPWHVRGRICCNFLRRQPTKTLASGERTKGRNRGRGQLPAGGACADRRRRSRGRSEAHRGRLVSKPREGRPSTPIQNDSELPQGPAGPSVLS